MRPCVLEDAEAMEAVWASVAAEGEWIGTELPLRAGWADRFRAAVASDDATWFAAEVDGAVVGGIYVGADGGLAHVGMAIVDGHRGAGFGRQLLDAGVAWARAAGCHKVVLEVWPHNDRAIALYRSAGFVEEGRLRRHYRRRSGALWDAVAMGLALDEDSPGR